MVKPIMDAKELATVIRVMTHLSLEGINVMKLEDAVDAVDATTADAVDGPIMHYNELAHDDCSIRKICGKVDSFI